MLVQAMTDVAHGLGLQVVGEGVTSLAAWETLRGLGCDMAQGFYISPPRAARFAGRWSYQSRARRHRQRPLVAAS
jgi:EAL domain-containing protein (putative c-di-GMP-specific phosphodiesterase class I)